MSELVVKQEQVEKWQEIAKELQNEMEKAVENGDERFYMTGHYAWMVSSSLITLLKQEYGVEKDE